MSEKFRRGRNWRERGAPGGSRDRSHSGEHPRSRHPPHLKGREIGLFYAKKQKETNKDALTRPLGTVLLSHTKKEQINHMLDSTEYKTFVQKTPGSYDHVQDSHFKRDFLRIINQTMEENLNKSTTNMQEHAVVDSTLLKQLKFKENDPKFLEMIEQRRKLPAFTVREEILTLVEENQVVVISGETGCGKTTQVAQFILDDYIEKMKGSLCKIICTQPRRISAIAVAERVADERCEALGNSTGYHIRLEQRFPREKGSIVFCTTGVVLKQMESDPLLSNVSHLILDEIHERDVLSDFVLALVKQVLNKRKDLKVILMSATLNAEKFSKYYNDAPHLTIPGFTYPVTEYYLEDVIERTNYRFPEKSNTSRGKQFRENQQKIRVFSDYIEPHVRQLENERKYSRNTCIQLRNPESEDLNLELILELLIDICRKEKDQGAILVFLTGFSAISKLNQLMNESGRFPQSRYSIFPIHSLMPTTNQRQIFQRPPKGVRKIVIATNIAETSITIDDVVFVIDCGKIKISNYDVAENRQSLNPEWVSLANANQRKGRAGRVQAGVCFHMYSRAREMVLEQYQKPEILRKRLDDVILTAKVLQLGKVEKFFDTLLDKPDPEAVANSLSLLKQLNALTEDESLTPLGYHLAKLPIAPQMGKMILFGAIFSCLDPILSIAAALDFKDPFQLPLGKEKEVTERKLELSNGVKSDHLLMYEALKMYEEHRHDNSRFWYYFLSTQTLKMLLDMKHQFMNYLLEMNFVSGSDFKAPEWNRNSDNISLVKAIICAGLYPNLVISKIKGKVPKLVPWVEKKKILLLHPKSVLAQEKYFESNLMVYYRRLKSTRDFIHDATLVFPLSVIFFGDKFSQIVDHGHNRIVINGNLNFKCSESTARTIEELRNRFNAFLEYKTSHPGPVVWDSGLAEIKVLETIMELITCEDTDCYDDGAFDVEDFD